MLRPHVPSLNVRNHDVTYHRVYFGAKLLLPLEYLRRCTPPNDTLVVFTDHDVVFQVR